MENCARNYFERCYQKSFKYILYNLLFVGMYVVYNIWIVTISADVKFYLILALSAMHSGSDDPTCFKDQEALVGVAGLQGKP